MIPDEEMDKIFSDYLKRDLVGFIFEYSGKIPEAEFGGIFIDLFDKYLNEICDRIRNIFPKMKFHKDLKHIGEQIFELEVMQKNTDNFYKIQFCGMIIVLKNYYSDIIAIVQKKSFYEDENFLGLMEYFKYLIVDSLIIIADCEMQHDIKPSREMAKQNILSSLDSFKSSLRLKIDLSTWSSLSSFNACVFLIRQSIELRIKNALGINFICDKNGRMIKIPGDKLLDFFFSKPEIELPDIKKSILKKIHAWTQYFVHGGYVLNLWQIDIAHTLLEPLFNMGEKNGSMSIYGGVKMSKSYYETKLKNDIEEFIDKNLFNGLVRQPYWLSNKSCKMPCIFLFLAAVVQKLKFLNNSDSQSKNDTKMFHLVTMKPEALIY
jgi:hypothetical protein